MKKKSPPDPSPPTRALQPPEASAVSHEEGVAPSVAPEVAPAPPRRQPVQARSRARVDAILDAADVVFLELGFANATTNHVAARAGTSIGSLYRFFPDKNALLVALAERYQQQMLALAAQLTQPSDARSMTLSTLVATGVDSFGQFLVSSPGFKTLIAEYHNPVLQAGRGQQDDQMAAIIGALQTQLAPHRPVEEQSAVAEVTAVVLTTLQGLALRGDEAYRKRILEEAKRMVTFYLAERLGIAPHASLSFLAGAPVEGTLPDPAPRDEASLAPVTESLPDSGQAEPHPG